MLISGWALDSILLFPRAQAHGAGMAVALATLVESIFDCADFVAQTWGAQRAIVGVEGYVAWWWRVDAARRGSSSRKRCSDKCDRPDRPLCLALNTRPSLRAPVSTNTFIESLAGLGPQLHLYGVLQIMRR